MKHYCRGDSPLKNGEQKTQPGRPNFCSLFSVPSGSVLDPIFVKYATFPPSSPVASSALQMSFRSQAGAPERERFDIGTFCFFKKGDSPFLTSEGRQYCLLDALAEQATAQPRISTQSSKNMTEQQPPAPQKRKSGRAPALSQQEKDAHKAANPPAPPPRPTPAYVNNDLPECLEAYAPLAAMVSNQTPNSDPHAPVDAARKRFLKNALGRINRWLAFPEEKRTLSPSEIIIALDYVANDSRLMMDIGKLHAESMPRDAAEDKEAPAIWESHTGTMLAAMSMFEQYMAVQYIVKLIADPDSAKKAAKAELEAKKEEEEEQRRKQKGVAVGATGKKPVAGAPKQSPQEQRSKQAARAVGGMFASAFASQPGRPKGTGGV